MVLILTHTSTISRLIHPQFFVYYFKNVDILASTVDVCEIVNMNEHEIITLVNMNEYEIFFKEYFSSKLLLF